MSTVNKSGTWEKYVAIYKGMDRVIIAKEATKKLGVKEQAIRNRPTPTTVSRGCPVTSRGRKKSRGC